MKEVWEPTTTEPNNNNNHYFDNYYVSLFLLNNYRYFLDHQISQFCFLSYHERDFLLFYLDRDLIPKYLLFSIHRLLFEFQSDIQYFPKIHHHDDETNCKENNNDSLIQYVLSDLRCCILVNENHIHILIK